MNITLRGAQATRDANKRLNSFSKQWRQGETWEVYYPITKDETGEYDIVAAATWGYAINDAKDFGLKRIFIPTTVEIVNGSPTEATLVHRFSRIAKLFLNGAKEAQIKAIESNNNIRPELKKKKLDAIEEEFENKSPIISTLRYSIVTECFMVRLGEGMVPDTSTACVVSQELSNGKVRALENAIKNLTADTTIPDEDKDNLKYLVVRYSFGTETRKADAGKVDPSYVSYSNTSMVHFSDIFKNFSNTISSLATSTEMIKNRNTNFKPVNEDDLLRCIISYTALNYDALESITEEETSDRLNRNALWIRDQLKTTLRNIDYTSLEYSENEKAKTKNEKIPYPNNELYIKNINDKATSDDVGLPPTDENSIITADEINEAIKSNDINNSELEVEISID